MHRTSAVSSGRVAMSIRSSLDTPESTAFGRQLRKVYVAVSDMNVSSASDAGVERVSLSMASCR